MAKQPTIKSSERVFIAGMTGSGKTYFAMMLLADLPRLVVIDHKGSDTITANGFLDEDSRETWRAFTTGRAVRVRVRNTERALEYMRAAMQVGDCVIYIDEVYAMVPPRERPQPEITAIWTRGRELGVGGWAATQRPTWLPLELVSEADWSVCFRLRLEQDRKRMAEYMGEEVEVAPKDKHGFYISAADWERPRYYPELSGNLVTTAKSTRPNERR